MAFNEAQVKSLEAKLNAKHVRTRQANDTTLTYVEGWHVIAEANRIFGYDGWDRRTLTLNCVWSGKIDKGYVAAYSAKVRVRVRAGAENVVREGCGCGEARAATTGEAHELALKSAETDATKRALATFGNSFGLALYDRELAGVTNRKALLTNSAEDPVGIWILSLVDGDQSFDRSEDFVAALRKALNETHDIEALFALWERNVDTVRAINKEANRGGTPSGIAHVLVAQLKGRAIALAKQGEKSVSSDALAEHNAPSKIDKSQLAIPEVKRIRSKDHLRFVARQPCVICGRMPTHAHHVRYAQPRGLALKVSDEFTVPLCATHHGQNHTTGDKRRWWHERKIDPLLIAAELWAKSPGRQSTVRRRNVGQS